MCKLLISVRSSAEAVLAQKNDANFIDLKDPEKGALGALDLAETASIIAVLNGKSVISATIGDLPMSPEEIDAAIARRAAMNINYLKVGFFPASMPEYQNCLKVIQHYTEQGYKIIVVLFADLTYPHALMTVLKQSDIAGVMLDTSNKNGKTLLDYCSEEQLTNFCEQMGSGKRLTGLAGSLRLADVQTLKLYRPDYLGFRGGVCHAGERNRELNPARISELSKVL